MEKIKIDTKFWNHFEEKLVCALVPSFSSDAVRPCAKEDFQDYTKNLENNLQQIIVALDDLLLNENQWTDDIKKRLIKVLVIIGEQHQESAWNNSSCVKLSTRLISRIFTIYKCENVSEILKSNDIFISIVMFLRPKLMKDTWKSYPATVSCYKWLLESMEKPLLKKYVTEVLPTALIIFDDYVPQNQSLGLGCISIIIDHCQYSWSLRNFNYDEVIYEALERMMYKMIPDMIIPVYSCVLNLLKNIELCNVSSNKYGWTKYDDILVILLDNMELQSNVQCRYSYAIILKEIFTYHNSGKQIKRLTRVLSEYCENINDLKTTDIALDLVMIFISTYQPIDINFYSSIYSSMLKLSLELSLQENNELFKKACNCIKLLNKLCPQLSKKILDNKLIKSVLEDL